MANTNMASKDSFLDNAKMNDGVSTNVVKQADFEGKLRSENEASLTVNLDVAPLSGEKCASDFARNFSLSSKEGQEHLRELNEELKALNAEGNPMLSVIHSAQEDTVSIMRRKHGGHRSKIKSKKRMTTDSSRPRYHLAGGEGKPSGENKTGVQKKILGKRMQSSSESNDDDFSNIDNILEEKACKMNLSTVNVKNLLRYVITNEHVLSMVHNSMQADGVASATYEPKLTRSKAKQLMEKQAEVPWPISPIKMPSPSKSKKLIEFEFSDSDGSSDEEYKPDKECESEDGESFLSSYVCEMTPPPPHASEIVSPSLRFPDFNAESVKPNEASYNEIEHEKMNQLTHESSEQEEQTEDTIALRTRSKLPLNDTPLEFIESNFIAPDITTDMYDSECDDEDWGNFLGEFLKPLAPDPNDDEANDPEYNFLEEEDIPDREDLRDDKAVKISKKEVHQLMAELLEVAQSELSEVKDVPNKRQSTLAKVSSKDSNLKASISKADKVLDSQCVVQLFDVNRRKQLDEQMRKHVQLLTQVFLLAADMTTEIKEKSMSKTLLVELLTFANKSKCVYGGISAFLSHNLNAAVDIVSNYKTVAVKSTSVKRTKSESGDLSRRSISTNTMKTIVNSRAFIYPSMLPIAGFRSLAYYQQNFIEAEDNLLALGLCQFKGMKNDGALSCWKLIKDNMLPTKTVKQISIRIKNRRSNKAPDNPVKNKEAPQMTQSTTPFDPHDVKPPIQHSLKILPEWIHKYSDRHKYRHLQPKPSKESVILEKCDNETHKESKPETCIHPNVSNEMNQDSKIELSDSKRKTQSPAVDQPIARPNAITLSLGTASIVSVGMGHKMRENTEIAAAPKSLIVSGSQPAVQRPSPLKQVSPILKKYSPICLRKTGGNLKPRRILPKITFVSRGCPRKLFPKMPVQFQKPNLPDKLSETSSATNKCIAEIKMKIRESPVEKAWHREQPETDVVQIVGSDPDSEQEMFYDDAANADMHADNEDDLAALMAASTTINTTPKHRQNMIRKRKKSVQERDELLALLAPELLENDPLKGEKATIYAHTYLQKAMDVIGEDANVFDTFLQLLNDFNHGEGNVVQLYKDVCVLLKDFPQLCEDFLVFLLPEQAMECGRFTEYLTLTKMQLFLRKLKVHFGKHPLYLQKTLKLLQHLQQQENLTMQQLMDTMIPLLRGQTHLVEEFLQLFPEQTPPERCMVNFEEIVLPDDTEITIVEDEFEVIKLPETEDTYGTKDCPCNCHNNSDKHNEQNRLCHCLGCGIKFIDGRIFLQCGKVLKPCRVIYHNKKNHKELVIEEAKESELVDSDTLGSHIQLTSPPSTVSNASAHILNDLVDERDASLQQSLEDVKELDVAPTSNPFLEALEQISVHRIGSNLEAVTTTEDAILTSDVSRHTLGSLGTPNDFSILRNVIHQSKDNCSETCLKPDSSQREEAFRKPVVQERMMVVEEDSATSSSQSAKHVEICSRGKPMASWTRESDRILLQTCQQLSPKKETFVQVAAKLQTKTPEEVEIRFEKLMKLFANNGEDRIQKETENQTQAK